MEELLTQCKHQGRCLTITAAHEAAENARVAAMWNPCVAGVLTLAQSDARHAELTGFEEQVKQQVSLVQGLGMIWKSTAQPVARAAESCKQHIHISHQQWGHTVAH